MMVMTTTSPTSQLLTVLALVARGGRRRLAQLRHQRQVLLVNLCIIHTTTSIAIPSISLLLAVLGNVPDAVTVSAKDVIGDVRLVRTLPGAVVVGAAVCTSRAVILAQRSVEEGQLPKLTAAKVVLVFWQFDALADDFVDLQKEKVFNI